MTIDNEKMSKSKGNFFMVRDAAKEFGYETIRMFMLSAHYRTPLNYSAESLEMNKASLARLYEARNNMEFRISKAEGDAMTAEETAKMEALAAYKQKFIDAMDDDLNTADALSAIFELTREINAYMGAHQDATKAFLTAAHALFMELTGVLNIVQKHEDAAADPDAEKIEALIAQRAAPRRKRTSPRLTASATSSPRWVSRSRTPARAPSGAAHNSGKPKRPRRNFSCRDVFYAFCADCSSLR